MGRMGTAWDVAHAVLFLVSDEANYVTGTEIIVDGTDPAAVDGRNDLILVRPGTWSVHGV